MTTQETATPHRNAAYTGPAILLQGFRPFFLLAGVWAVVALALSVEMMQGHIEIPTAWDAMSWHFHEMLFGFVAAALAGFLLTAIPNWTGRLPLQGAPLLGLVALWVAGRVALMVSDLIGAWPAALIDLAFLLVLGITVGREIISGRNWRNLPIALMIVLLLASNALFHAEMIGIVETDAMAPRLAIAVVVALILLIGGRVVPSFTLNWLMKRGATKLPKGFGAFDRAILLVTAVVLVFWVIAPDGALTASLTGLAALLNLVRWLRWRGVTTYPEPLLWVLHTGYLWVPAGFALLSLSHWWPALSPTAALHALTAGAMGTMTLAMMSRATLGHTGRALHAGLGLTTVYLLVNLSALLRIGSTFGDEPYSGVLIAAAIAWIAAFLLYLGICGPMLLTRKRA